MFAEPSVIELVTEVLDTGRTPEEVCSQYPHLLEEVRQRVARCRKLNSRLDLLFSPPDSEGEAARSPSKAKLPEIPGYQVRGIIGEGGMGVVYGAYHLKLKRVVALKMLRSGDYASPVELERFSLEAEAIAGLQHPHIVEIHDLGEVDGRPYFTMEYLEGGSLAQKLNGVPLRAAEAARFTVLMASAMEAAHRAGIVHRDLKPANVLFSKEEQLKISDFGLARRVAIQEGITLSGARMGTPSYMAPEQAAGQKAPIGPEADVYALGAILYEMLTGRPPFRGVSVSDTERQVIHDDPAAPRRLNTSVPRDLETICLKCLQKSPARRYASAEELGKDVTRFERGEPILARKTGTVESMFKWVRRHRALATGIAGTVVILCLVLGASVWWFSQRASVTRAVNDDLEQAVRFQREGKYANADSMLERAIMRLGDGGPVELRGRLELVKKDSQLVARIKQIRKEMWKYVAADGHFSKTDLAYASLFREAGFGTDADLPAQVAERICRLPVRGAVLEGLDDWARCLENKRMFWVIQVTELVDPAYADPKSWRAQVRKTDPKLWYDRERLMKLIEEADVKNESPQVLLGLVVRCAKQTADPIRLFERIQQAHPDDFTANLELATYLARQHHTAESVRYYEAAIALQPDAAAAHYNLAYVLSDLGRRGDAIVELEKALAINPDEPEFHAELGIHYWHTGQYEKAMPHLEVAIRKDPESSAVHYQLGKCYVQTHHDAEAIEQFRLSIGLKPNLTKKQEEGRRLFIENEMAEELRLSWEWALKTNPQGYEPREGYAELCVFVDKNEEYQKECTKLLKEFGDSQDAVQCLSIGMACMLGEQSPENLQIAVAMVDRARTKAPPNLYEIMRLAQGLSEYRQGHRQKAISLLEKPFPREMQPAGPLVLAMAQFRDGQAELARETFSNAIAGKNWEPTLAQSRWQWILQVLRREAEKVVFAK